MKRPVDRFRTAALCAALLAVAGGTPARAATDSTREIRVSPADDAAAVRLGRAALEHRAGNPRGVIESLEGMAFAPEPDWAEADRAAFLLGEAYLALGSEERFRALAAEVSGWKRNTVFTRWLAAQRLAMRTRGGAAGDSAMGISPEVASRALDASLSLRSGDAAGALQRLGPVSERGGAPLAIYVEALALERAGRDATPAWRALAEADTVTRLGRDLAGAALLRLAALERERGADAGPLLARVPAGSRHASAARHMLGLDAIERGEFANGAAILDSLLALDPGYASRREVEMALAGLALEAGRWEDANRKYEGVDREWTERSAALARPLTPAAVDTLWTAWREGAGSRGPLVIDEAPARLLASRLAAEAADLTSRPAFEVPAPDAPARGAWGAVVAAPGEAAWNEAAASERRLAEREHALERARWAAERERGALAEARRYLGIGQGAARGEEARSGAWYARLDSLRHALDDVDARLRAVRDEEIRRIGARTAAIARNAEGNLLWMRSMRHFHLDGADASRVPAPPPGEAGPDSVLAREEALARAVADAARSMADETPGRIARSYEQAWRPRLIDRAAAEAEDAGRALAWARTLGRTLDSAASAAGTSEMLRSLEAALAPLARDVDSLRAADRGLHQRLAREALAAERAATEAEREGIDYGLGAAAWGRSVRLAPRDSAQAAASHTPADTLEEADDPETARWRALAIQRLTAFLDRHPGSFARAETRFRLADLELVAARQAFRERMTSWLRSPGGSRGPVPVLSHARALVLYRAILAEDPAFAHRDAVLFNTAMILADEGNPEADQLFGELVSRHPQSVYVQESNLRMGDTRFAGKRFAECVDLYRQAAAGPDPTLRVVASYKMGWAHFNQDRFAEAAGAFRDVLDLYASRRAEIQVDIEGEAESYLVYSLAGAGGAPAFAAHFGAAGSRAYERRVLMALGQHFRRYGEYPKAAAADEMCIRRYPREPEALVSATRLIETWHRSNRPAEERSARLELAPRFAPGSEWQIAQRSDSVRAAGSEFARAAWTTVAFEDHRKARAGGTREDWSRALELYTLLLFHWPASESAPSLELGAGEASAQLGDFPGALRHYGAAARTGPDSVAVSALWQRVAVTDRWYQSTRPARGAAGTGSDSLAKAVIEAGDALLARAPAHPGAADLIWRQSQLAIAHGWDERAASDLGHFVANHAGDSRAPLAGAQRGEALFRRERFAEAGLAFEDALGSARRAGLDSLARVVGHAMAVCCYRVAEAAVAADSSAFVRHAVLFEEVATRFPRYERAPLAQYRAGLARIRARQLTEAVRVMRALVARFPQSEYARDARLQVATLLEAAGDREPAAAAWAEVAERDPDQESAKGAWLKRADLLEAAGLALRAEAARLDYIRRYPDDAETAMTILEPLARRDLDGVGAARPLAALLDPPARARRAAIPPSHLADWLRRAETRPALASREIFARLRFAQAEESRAAFDAATLVQPLAKSLTVKQRLLDTLLVRYRRAVDLAVPEWAHASVFRIGEALVGFGEALEGSERPADLKGDDRLAYEDVLMQQSQPFHQRGEDVWTDLLRKLPPGAAADPWTLRAQEALWKRLSKRFYYLPEVEYPLVAATPPRRERPAESREGRAKPDSQGGDARTLRRGGSER